MRSRTIRIWLIALVAVAAIVNAVGTHTGNALVSWLGFAIFLCAVFVYAAWRRRVRAERAAGTGFDREAKTREAGTRADR